MRRIVDAPIAADAIRLRKVAINDGGFAMANGAVTDDEEHAKDAQIATVT